jgi:hypothetical protein
MQNANPLLLMFFRKRNKPISSLRLSKIAHHWDRAIRRNLHRFAQDRWPDVWLAGLIPIHLYRLRRQLEPETFVWWVERDIPPYDRHLCEAYRVELSLADPDKPRMIVRSSTSIYPLALIDMDSLNAALVQAGADKPLVIQRQFGPALDP